MVNNNCGGGQSRWETFCIGMNLPASNATPSGASVINSCGTQYNGTTQGGYYPSNNSSPSLGNIDNNSSTSCPTSFGGNCGSNGNDVPFVINNPSYFTFCAAASGTYNINFDVGTCTQPQSGAQGAQMAILIGSASSMTLNQVAPNPTLPSDPVWTSSDFSLAAGQCAYLVVDGFAGDMCTYSYTLNNVDGGCLLPIELVSFSAQKERGENILEWVTASEKNNAYFTIEKSADGIHFKVFAKVKGAGTSYDKKTYQWIDNEPYDKITYYRLSQTDYDGTTKTAGIIAVQNEDITSSIRLYPNPLTEGTLIIEIPSYREEKILINVVDVSGKVIKSEDDVLQSGKNTLEISLPDLEKGMYFVQIEGRTLREHLKLVISCE